MSIVAPTPMFEAYLDWHLATAPRKQPFLALLSAISAFSTLMGNAWRTPTAGKVNVCLVALAGTGLGKDHPQHQAKTLLKVLGRGELIGPDTIGSDAGLDREMAEYPVKVCFADEFNVLLSQWSSKHAASYQTGIVRSFNMYFNGKETQGKALADKDKKNAVADPFLSVLFFGQPATFYEKINKEMASIGFWNRMLIYDAAVVREEPPLVRLPDLVSTVPPEFKKMAGSAAMQLTDNQEMVLNMFAGQAAHSGIQFMRWDPVGEEEYKKVHKELEKKRIDFITSGQSTANDLTARGQEYVLKLATIAAWTDGGYITQKHIAWAKALVDISNSLYLNECPHVFTQAHDDFTVQRNAVLKEVATRGTMTLTEITRFLEQPVPIRDKVLHYLLEAGALHKYLDGIRERYRLAKALDNPQPAATSAAQG